MTTSRGRRHSPTPGGVRHAQGVALQRKRARWIEDIPEETEPVVTETMLDSAGTFSVTWHMSWPFLISTISPTNSFRAPCLILNLLAIRG
ncbi:MAG: hypothetical protein WBE26_13355 [Phycisphaerae bacterium]